MTILRNFRGRKIERHITELLNDEKFSVTFPNKNQLFEFYSICYNDYLLQKLWKK